jgi:DNA-binding response OmpR family regulator
MSHTILYVEDETAIVELVHVILEHPDIRLIATGSGADGLARAKREKPDLLILDVMIPDRNGWDIYYELRRDDDLKHVPIIMLTGQLHRYRIMKEFARSPIDAYITKPFDARAVRRTVEQMLGVSLWASGELVQ